PRTKRWDIRRETQGVERLRQRLLDNVLPLDDRAGETRTVPVQLGPELLDEGEKLLPGRQKRRRRLAHLTHPCRAHASGCPWDCAPPRPGRAPPTPGERTSRTDRAGPFSARTSP